MVRGVEIERTSELLFTTSFTAKCAQTTYELLKVDRSTSTIPSLATILPASLETSTRGRGRDIDTPALCWRDGVTYSSSKIAIIRCAKGLFAICGICKNSSRSIEPDPSLSSFMNLFFNLRSSGPETITTVSADFPRRKGENESVGVRGSAGIGRDIQLEDLSREL